LRFPQAIVIAVLALACALAPAHAEKRVALVIGNGAYVHADKLTNPINDARGMRDALAGLKFDVIYGEDLGGQALRRKIGEFAGRVDDADVAIVYFAGHGATFGDAPYVVPIDAEFAALDQMPYELIAVETLIVELRRAKGVRIAILDACRDNGAEQALKQSRVVAASRGLAPPKNPAGLIIAYATQHGATAADSAGSRNSPFTASLIANIATPGLDVTDMFRKVGREVDAATGGRQRPEISISMYEQYVLAPSAAAGPSGGSAAVSEAERTWGIVQNTTSVAVLDDYISRFGDVPIYGNLARAKREELAKSQEAAVVAPLPPSGIQVVTPPSGAAPLTAAQERGLRPKDSFLECENCPELVVVPAGSFTMGSPKGEKDRIETEGPQHLVTISKPFAVGKFHVTVDQFAAFVRETGYYDVASKCESFEGSKPQDRSWRSPGFAQEGSHPVVCVSWDAAKAYVDWLAKKTGRPYRLLSEAEWEYAARGRTSPGAYPRFWFGNDEKILCRYGNFWDQKGGYNRALCNDRYANTSPAGHYEPNSFGLYDMFGNAWQWMADCWHHDYSGAPADGSAWTTGCPEIAHVVRGGSWDGSPGSIRAASRIVHALGNNVGFRVARTLAP
jgi:formylglycine-generating enzyme required for sulfatase activity/uncharacterized caspase-like protein